MKRGSVSQAMMKTLRKTTGRISTPPKRGAAPALLEPAATSEDGHPGLSLILLHETAHALGAAMETRCQWTGMHQNRVSRLAEALGQTLGLDADQLVGLKLGGQLHDIGKFVVPNSILTKPTRLSDAEFSLIKEHPKAGYDIVKHVSFPWPVAQMVLHHHERMDGSGYPTGLKGEDILLEARILAVADVIESMMDDRPYRQRWELRDILLEIEEKAGLLYDPLVADATNKLFRKQGFRLD